MTDVIWWVGFNIFIVAALALDLGVFQRRSHAINTREALLRSGVWIGLALLFCLGIYATRGSVPALNFLTGYIIELSLSVDNLFVILSIFTYFAVPKPYLHRVLFWGIISAIILRAAFIFAGVALFNTFSWMTYFFGLLLIVTGIKLALSKDEEVHPEKNLVLMLMRKFIPVIPTYEGNFFFVKKGTQYWATPLFVTLLVIETSDIMFAIDSVPAILAITTDPFIVFTSNVFAILGLRSLYFAIEGMMEVFHYLHYGLALILILIGIKMLFAHHYEIPISVTLISVAVILTTSIVASLLFPQQE